ncbi:MAG TPA: hypothetical protein VK308_14570 [Pyrinomonadaceae bacterium]|nr:hypothetical protein [Pyrinomonadaceae bacterium]
MKTNHHTAQQPRPQANRTNRRVEELKTNEGGILFHMVVSFFAGDDQNFQKLGAELQIVRAEIGEMKENPLIESASDNKVKPFIN